MMVGLPDYVKASAGMTRLLITGGSSYVGQHVVPLAVSAGYEVCHTFYSRDLLQDGRGVQLDLRDETAVAQVIGDFWPDGILHLAGSNRPDDMARLIEEGTRHVAQAAESCGARLIHMSTDVIFDGLSAPYREDDLPTPVHDYGRAKANAERLVKEIHKNAVIVRPSLIYGLQIVDRGTEWVMASLRQGTRVTLFTNQLRTPIWVDTLNLACLELLHLPYKGVLHIGGSQQLSRASFGGRLLDWWGFDQREMLAMEPAPIDAPWPPDTTLDSTQAEALLQTSILGVDEVIQLAESRN